MKAAVKHGDLKNFSSSLDFKMTKKNEAKFEQTNDSSLRNFFVQKTRDQPKPGSLFGKMRDPGNEVEVRQK